ncbi:MAG: endonuclease/exonuclease/phosphatase family protein [Alphaproteobacteria bacterium]|nr:endonuclease/exonuclease/phosphatase family protein [Alphaproteobacteria bacterium]MBU1516039.1 endonuclease/exonuclease/phosphatase family protein [Alphaproteobacteria bacterium]MBU2092746.1 endonuclease/exonuclease/phosphatase family protein [Alphaproteobacteria bacterium]MBU2153729.1 endonuclease/exonuclease/phosphatase family protein [Alphaproteobacteria bacterium]MBU2308357.1 endonuclease/exonuclease/phosphatase family protein [Alphaproteobacteria bacterium]
MYLEPVDQIEAYAETSALGAAEISVLTYNIRGLPWPIATGRGKALREIGRELAALRREGRQPDVVLIQEGFRDEVAWLFQESGYKYWAQGPGRTERTAFAGAVLGARDLFRGEGVGKLMGGGLHVLSDAPIVDVRSAAYNNCAGVDCLANKGAMLVRLAPPGLPTTIDVVNTHMNSRKASMAPRARTLPAHNGQVRELSAFLQANRTAGAPLLLGGDFNVRNSPARYYFDALERPYTVVSEFCSKPDAACGPGAADATSEPWLRTQDLQAFSPGAVRVRPVRSETLFGMDDPKRRLSDHEGYLVRYRLSWTAQTLAAYRPGPAMDVKPHKLGVKVSWRP